MSQIHACRSIHTIDIVNSRIVTHILKKKVIPYTLKYTMKSYRNHTSMCIIYVLYYECVFYCDFKLSLVLRKYSIGINVYMYI